MSTLLSSIAVAVSGVAVFFSGLFAPPPVKVNTDQFATKIDIQSVYSDLYTLRDTLWTRRGADNLGATNAVPSVVALFETSLASAISSSATSFTLVSATDLVGTTLASSTYGFIIDEGTASQEMVLADCTATACTNATRGLSVVSGTTTVASLQKAHRRGASVKITDGPILNIISRIVNGIGTFPNRIRYTSQSAASFTDGNDIVNRTYVDSLAFGAVPAASETASGFVELSTGIETASSTSSGSAARLVIPASLATSTYNSATAALRVVVTQNSGKIDANFLDLSSLGTTTFTGLVSTTATTTFATASTSSFTSTFTWTKPAQLKQILVKLQAGGNTGGTGDGGTAPGGGGGGGAYCEGYIAAAQLGATETVTIGAAAANSSFGALITAAAGTAANVSTPGTGGDCGGTITKLFKIENFDGTTGFNDTGPAVDISNGGVGGGCMFGEPGQPAISASAGASGAEAGQIATGYGCGGGGGVGAVGGAGAPGILGLTEIFN